MIQSVSNQTQQLISTSQNQNASHMYVGPYRLEKTLGKGQTGKEASIFDVFIRAIINATKLI